MSRSDDIVDALRRGNPVPRTGPRRLADTDWGRALHDGITCQAAPDDDRMTSRPRRGLRRRLPPVLALGVLLATAGGVVAVTGIPGGHGEPGEPRPELARPSDPEVAAVADPAAAERILRAGGWSPREGSLELAASASAAGSDYALWAYRGPNGPAVLLVAHPDLLGGVHSECASAEVTICGMASSSTGYLLVVGTTAPTAERTTIALSDGNAIDAPTGGGYWFARVPFGDSSPRPTVIASVDASGDPVGRLPAERLRQEIAQVLAGPPAVE